MRTSAPHYLSLTLRDDAVVSSDKYSILELMSWGWTLLDGCRRISCVHSNMFFVLLLHRGVGASLFCAAGIRLSSSRRYSGLFLCLLETCVERRVMQLLAPIVRASV